MEKKIIICDLNITKWKQLKCRSR